MKTLDQTKQELENSLGGAASSQRVLTVNCGAETIQLEDMQGQKVRDVKSRSQELLNVSDEHRTALVNGQAASDDQVLDGTETVEFVRQAGQKG